jgi:hypothetical protein
MHEFLMMELTNLRLVFGLSGTVRWLNGLDLPLLRGRTIYDSRSMETCSACHSFSSVIDVVVLSPAAVTPPTITSLTLNPATVLGGIIGTGWSTGTVTLSSAAPAGGVVIFLSSSSPVAQVPSMIRVAAGSTTATFTVTTSMPMGSVIVTISATTGSSTKTATLTVTDVGS